MLKNFFAFYGLMRFLERAADQPPEENNDGCSCGCLLLLIIAILACL